MRKILIVIVLSLFSIVLVGCDKNDNFRNELVFTIKALEFDRSSIDVAENDGLFYSGTANIVAHQENEIAIINITKDGKAIMLEISILEETLNYFCISDVSIQYINLEKNLDINLYYYADYKYKKLSSLDKFIDNLEKLTMKDYELILKDLGY
mgnify:CR=1 FL=1